MSKRKTDDDQFDLFAEPAAAPVVVAVAPDPYVRARWHEDQATLDRVLEEFRKQPDASYFVGQRLGLESETIRNATRQLYEANKLRETSERKETPEFTRSIIWEVVP